MLGDLLKAIEMILNAVKGVHSPDHKREALAKELMNFHKQIDGLVGRGRKILALEPAHESSKQNPAVHMLSEQIGAIKEINETLTSSLMSDVLQLHLPKLRRGLVADLDSKSKRIWIRLDGLLSDGQWSPTDWVNSMEAKMMTPGEETDFGSPAWIHPLVVCDPIWKGDGPLDADEARPFVDECSFGVRSSQEDLTKGYQLLDQIDAANQELGKFLVEKFKFEDVL